MCVTCNCDDIGDRFLDSFHQARERMRDACGLMLECSLVAEDKEASKSYDKAHKKIVRIIREWNKIEHEREHHKETNDA